MTDADAMAGSEYEEELEGYLIGGLDYRCPSALSYEFRRPRACKVSSGSGRRPRRSLRRREMCANERSVRHIASPKIDEVWLKAPCFDAETCQTNSAVPC